MIQEFNSKLVPWGYVRDEDPLVSIEKFRLREEAEIAAGPTEVSVDVRPSGRVFLCAAGIEIDIQHIETIRSKFAGSVGGYFNSARTHPSCASPSVISIRSISGVDYDIHLSRHYADKLMLDLLTEWKKYR